MSKETEHIVDWSVAETFIAAGNVGSVHLNEDMTDAKLEVYYIGDANQKSIEHKFHISCSNCAYLLIRRYCGHENGAGSILEAYLLENSPLIDDLLSNRLESKTGTLSLPSDSFNSTIKHLQIIGELSVDILCAEVTVTQFF